MKKIIVTDMTLPLFKSQLSFKEKIEISRHLDNLNVDVIEMPQIDNIKTDTLLVRTISAFVKNSTISVSAGMTKDGIENALAALASAKKKRIKIELPVSTVQMEYTCHKKAPKMLELAKELFKFATDSGIDIEFSAIDATRADAKFLTEIINAAITAGVKYITICDNEASMLPDEFASFTQNVIASCENAKGVKFGIMCKNRNDMVTASTIMAVRSGIDEVKTSLGGDIPKLDIFADLLHDCGDRLGFSIDVKFTQLHRISKQIKWILGNKEADATITDDASTEEIPLDENDDISVITDAINKLGYDLSEEDNKKVYDEFKRVAAKKKVGNKELEAIIASVAMQVPPTFKILSYVVNNGNIISSSAQIKLQKDMDELTGICIGDGPIDAAFRAIEQIIGHHYELDDFQIQAVTQGKDSVGSAIVKLRDGGKLYSGTGVSTDIIGASIRAYINAVNKIVYEEEN